MKYLTILLLFSIPVILNEFVTKSTKNISLILGPEQCNRTEFSGRCSE